MIFLNIMEIDPRRPIYLCDLSATYLQFYLPNIIINVNKLHKMVNFMLISLFSVCLSESKKKIS